MTDQLLPDIETFLAESGMAESRFGRDAVNDTTFIPQLRAGREPRRATVNAVRAFMTRYRAQAPLAQQVEA